MKKVWLAGWMATIIAYIACILLMQHASFRLFSLQGEVMANQIAQIRSSQQIMETGRMLLLFLSLAGFVCCGMLSMKKRVWLLWGLATVFAQILFAVLYSKWMTGVYFAFAEAYQFQKWFWIILLIGVIGFYLAGRKKEEKVHV